MDADGSCSSVLSQDVKSIDRGGFRCLLCGVNVPNHPSLTDHLKGKRHVRLYEERDRRSQQQERSVYVSNFPRETIEEQLRDVFQKIAPVKHIVMDKDRNLYAIVEFESKNGMCAALAESEIKLHGKSLRVKQREKKEFQRKKGGGPRTLQPPDPEALCKELLICTDVEDQLRKVVSLCSPSHQESRLRELLLSLLKETFTEFFPGCQLLPFGSSVNGFEISGCDLDLYLELGEEEERHEMEESLEDLETEKTEVQMKIKDEEEEDVSPGLSLQGLSHEEVLEVVGKVLRHCVPGVHGVQSVPSARRPVIHFHHKISGLRGDITLNNRLALRNSSFLRFCSDMDPRVAQLVYTVRYWARVNHLAGNPLGGGPLLNNYALTLLVFFFLQTRSPPVIPTLIHLREESDNEVPQVIDGWDCSFPSDPTQVKDSENQQSLCSLLSEFFTFYASLDLHSLVICPCSGLTVPLPFSSPLPSWTEGFRVGPLNLQDPFELSHNVCGNVSSRTARRFISYSAAAVRVCRSPQYNFRSSSCPWGITLLLLPPPTERDWIGRGGAEILIPSGGDSLEKMCFVVRKVLVDVLFCTWSTRDRSKEDGSVKGNNEINAVGQGEWKDGKIEESEQEVPYKAGLSNTVADTDKNTLCKHEEMITESLGKKRETPEHCLNYMKNVKRIKKEYTDIVVKKANEISETNTDCSENGTAQWELHVWYKVWEGRRKERRRMQRQEAQGIELEASVSRALGKGEKPVEPLIRMSLNIQLTDKESVLLSLMPTFDPKGHSSTFFHFLEGYLPRMVAQIQNCEEFK
ncbi:hypothetical protein GDO86_008567 [Hymenochirus boettgeri]|uniref:Speckle targeted PIP5K1A-regulated poly(A) polymerase n=1 Tax=Hymenochirus boettgeri TaxID=247094 RepID=A0A8T2J0Y0_9PIPI|nr:hypothetical protein GDO86_008567 [Hymenochirus boettgeri]